MELYFKILENATVNPQGISLELILDGTTQPYLWGYSSGSSGFKILWSLVEKCLPISY